MARFRIRTAQSAHRTRADSFQSTPKVQQCAGSQRATRPADEKHNSKWARQRAERQETPADVGRKQWDFAHFDAPLSTACGECMPHVKNISDAASHRALAIYGAGVHAPHLRQEHVPVGCCCCCCRDTRFGVEACLVFSEASATIKVLEGSEPTARCQFRCQFFVASSPSPSCWREAWFIKVLYSFCSAL
jgi:hypothetical protein